MADPTEAELAELAALLRLRGDFRAWAEVDNEELVAILTMARRWAAVCELARRMPAGELEMAVEQVRRDVSEKKDGER